MASELKASVSIVISRDKNVYHCSMPVGAPYGEAYDVTLECAQKILELSKKSLDTAQTQYNNQAVEKSEEVSNGC